MSPETKKWAWLGGLAAGTAALVGAIVFWPKKASAATPPQKGYVKYTSTWSSPIFPAKVGDTLTIDLPSLEGTRNRWHVDGADNVGDITVDNDHGQNPGKVHVRFTKAGNASIYVRKDNIDSGQLAEPGMVVNVAVS